MAWKEKAQQDYQDLAAELIRLSELSPEMHELMGQAIIKSVVLGCSMLLTDTKEQAYHS